MNYFKTALNVLFINISVLTVILFLFVQVDKQCWRTKK
jgi:hypothetical protein